MSPQSGMLKGDFGAWDAQKKVDTVSLQVCRSGVNVHQSLSSISKGNFIPLNEFPKVLLWLPHLFVVLINAYWYHGACTLQYQRQTDDVPKSRGWTVCVKTLSCDHCKPDAWVKNVYRTSLKNSVFTLTFLSCALGRLTEGYQRCTIYVNWCDRFMYLCRLVCM